ncbi:MAG: hypothetical protein ACYSTL_07430, partial [Planctomycetota bacterium]
MSIEIVWHRGVLCILVLICCTLSLARGESRYYIDPTKMIAVADGPGNEVLGNIDGSMVVWADY